MLVLSRKRSEMIQIGDDVVVKVIKTGKGSVKIGIEAPEHVKVLRGELCEAPRPVPPVSPAGPHEPADGVPPAPVPPRTKGRPGGVRREDDRPRGLRLDSRQMLAVCSDQFPHPHVSCL